MLSVTHLTRSYDENGGAMTSLDQHGLDRSDAHGSADDPHAPLLAVDDLHVEFRTRDGVLNAVNGVSFSLHEGETLSVLGESGSGKSVTAQAVMGIIDTPPGFITHGRVRFRGEDLLGRDDDFQFRGPHISMIFQDALSALNPVFTVGWQISEMYRKHYGTSKAEAKQRAIELMDRVRIPSAASRYSDFPHQFSGGMRQRIMIAIAIALDPEVLIADEPTTALDVTVQAQIMSLLRELQLENHMGLLLITHDLGVVADVSDRIAVMYAGRIMEKANVNDLYSAPAHPYTLGLLASVPRLDQKGQDLTTIQGMPPSLANIPDGCEFHPRCPFRIDRCFTEQPLLRDVAADRRSACHRAEEVLGGDV